jgi:asparagine synthetase B (glutamine-hydrolysing)
VRLSKTNSFELPPNSLLTLSLEDSNLIYKRWNINPSIFRFPKDIAPLQDKEIRNNKIKELLLMAVSKRVLSIP